MHSESNSYSSLSLSNCFKKYTLSILQELNPDVLILSGTKIISVFDKFSSEINLQLPRMKIIKCFHYAARGDDRIRANEIAKRIKLCLQKKKFKT